MKYFVGQYVTYYEGLQADSALLTKANSVLSAVSDISSKFEDVTNYASNCNWKGQANNQVVSSSLPTLESRVSILSSNISGSLVPACQAAMDLLEQLGIMKEKDELLETLNEQLKTLNASIESASNALNGASNYETDSKGKSYYTGEKDRLQSEYDSLVQQKNELLEQIKSLETELKAIKTECDTLIEQIKSYDSAITLFDGTDVSTGEIAEISGLELAVAPDGSFIWEQNGIFYMIPTRFTKNQTCQLKEPAYIVCFDSNKLRNTLGEYADMNFSSNGMTYYDYIMTGLRQLTSSQNCGTLFNFATNNYKSETSTVIARVMNQMLEDTYAYNQASTVSEYAALAAITCASNPIVHFDYGACGNDAKTVGLNSIIAHGGHWDCIGFVRWAYYQGIQKLYPNATVDYSNFSPASVMWHDSTIDLDSIDCSTFSFDNVQVGSIITKKTADNYHIAMVVGRGVDKDGAETLVLAHSTGFSNGVIINEYRLDTLYENWTKSARGLDAGLATQDDIMRKFAQITTTV